MKIRTPTPRPSPASGRGESEQEKEGRRSSAPTLSKSHQTPLSRLRGRGGGWEFLLLLLLASMFIATGIGQVHLSPGAVLTALRHGPASWLNGGNDGIVWDTHLPRILMAALVGASLAAAGVAFQALLRNDLADPYVIGVSAGASVGAEAVLIKGGEAWLGGLAYPLAAFASATAAMLTIYAMARRGGRVLVTSLLLSGVVVSSFLGGVSTLLLLLGPTQETQFILGRLMGTLEPAGSAISPHLSSVAWQPFQQDVALLLFLSAGLLVLSMEARAMNLFALGEESAQQLGIETERFKVVLILTGSLLTAATVAFAGIIGFVGLMSPHIARRLARTPDHRRVLPLATLCGAILMVWADTIARSIFSDGRELPVGVVTAFLGAPFFIYLLRRHQR